MSKTVDSRVVEMRFDNAQFERNVKTTMTTLEKLKEKLKFSGASRGLDDIEKSAKHVDMSGLGRGVDTIKMKFSAMEVVAMTALSNITTTAMRVEKSIADALTIDPVKDGFAEYETQMNAVQTILANTQKEGTTVKDVNKALDELNTYADKTIYNFTEMTRNIGTFTAAGVKLDASVSAIKGIANLAAVSGSTSQQASTAMYQLSQALAAGKVQLMDWNSVVNAGMGGQVFQDALIRTSERLGTGAKEYIEAEGSFRESLQHGWLTSEVLTQTLDQFATAADTQEEYNAAVKKFVEQGYSQEEAKQMADMAKTANDAATKVKTFSQLIDTVKEALGSGWTRTWQLIIGDFEDAKTVWTNVSDVLSNLINKSADARNKLVKKVMGNPYSGLLKSINEITDKAEGLQDIVNSVIRGNYGNGQPRFDKLAEEGYNWARVQNKVNEQLGCSFRYSEDLGGSQEDLQKVQAETISQLLQMSDAQLIQNGLTKDEVKALRELQKQSENTGIPIQSLIDDISQLSGRDLLFGSFKNIGKSLLNLFKSLKAGWNDVFDPPSAYTLYNILAAIHKKTAQLAAFTEEHGDQLHRTMAGLAAILDIIRMTVGGTLKFGIKALNAVLSAFGMDTLDVTANLGDLLVKFDKWIKEVDPFTVVFQDVGKGIKFLIDKFKDLYTYLNGIPQVKKFFDSFKDIDLKKIGQKFIDDIKNFDLKTAWDNLADKVRGTEVGSAIINGFEKGLKDGITSIPEILLDIGKAMLDSIKKTLDINSPSKKMEQIGKWAIEGLFNGLKEKARDILDYIKNLGSDMLGAFKGVDWNSILAVGALGGLVVGINKIVGVIDKFASPFDAIGSVIDGFSEIEESASKLIKAGAFKTKMEGIKQFAEAILIVAGSIYLLGSMDVGKLVQGGVATTIIAGVLLGIAFAMTKISKASASINRKGIKLNGLKTGMSAIGVAVLLIGTTVKMLGGMKPDALKQGIIALYEIVGAMGLLYGAFGLISLSKGVKHIDEAGAMMKKVATAMLLMIVVVKLASKLSSEEMLVGVAFASAFTIFIGILGHISNKAGDNIDKLGKGIKSLVVAMGLMVAVVKLIGLLSVSDILKGIVFATSFAVFVGLLAAVTQSNDGGVLKGLNSLLLSVSVSMGLMAATIKLIGKLSPSEMIKGGLFAAAFVAFIKILTQVITVSNEEQTAKIAGTILSVSLAIGILAGVSVLLGMVNTKNLVKGEIAVGALCAMVAIMVRQLRGANDVGKSITGMAVAIGIMAASVAALSLIKTDKLAASTLALSTLMGMFAIVEKASSVATTSLKTIIMMTAVVAALAGILVLMNQYDFNASASNAAALSTIMLGLAAASAILGKVDKIDNSALLTIGILSAIVSALGLVLGALNKSNLSVDLKTVAGLSTLINALASACLILSKIGSIDIKTSLNIGALLGIVTGVSALLVALAGVIDLIPGAEKFMDGGIKILEKIGTGIGKFLGSIIGGFTVGATNGLPEVGKNIAGFINAFSNINDAATKGLDAFATFVQTILEITVTNIIDGIAEKLGFGSGLDNFAGEAEKFGKAMKAMSDALTGDNAVDSEAIEGAVKAGKMLSDLKKNLPADPGEVLEKFVFSRDLGDFGEQAKKFGEALSAMSKALTGDNAVDAAAIKGAVKAGKMLSSLKENLPSDPGFILGLFTTNQDLGNFGEQAQAFGEALSAMSKAVSGDNAVDSKAIENAKNAGELLSAFKENLPSDPGFILGLFTTNQDLGNFGEQAEIFGKAIGAMSKAVSGDNAVDSNAIENAKNAGTMLVELQKAIPESHWLDGKMQLDTFGTKISSFGNSLSIFGNYVSEVDFSQVKNGLTQIERIIDISSNASEKSDVITDGLTAFNSAVSISATLADFYNSISDIDVDKTSDSITIGYRLKNFISSLKDIDTTGVNSFKEAVSSLSKVELGGIQNTLSESMDSFATSGKSIVEVLSDGISSQKSKQKASNAMDSVVVSVQKSITSKNDDFKHIGIALITMLAIGMQSMKDSVINAAASISAAGISGIQQSRQSFVINGMYLGHGLVNGINAMQNSVYNAGFVLGQTAVRGERAGQQSHSPSKATYQSGIWLGEGMINACHDIASKVFSSGRALGEGVVDTISAAMQSAEDIFDAKADVAPVITPVVDLTDIRTGAAQITSMFNNPSVIPMTNIRAISGMMNNRQNGNNADVVSAINKLGKSIGQTGNIYNNIAGITYDDGSAVSDAISELIRAAKIERRR